MATYSSTIAQVLRSVLAAISEGRSHEAAPVAPILETPDGGAVNAQSDESGNQKVAVETSELPEDAATETKQDDVISALGVLLSQVTGAAIKDAAENLEGASIPASATGAVTPSDATEYDPPLRFLTATGAGDIALVLSGSTNTITLTVSANERITSLLISKVKSTGTDATGISGAA